MSVVNITDSDVTAILKKIIAPAVVDQLENKTVLLKHLRKDQERSDAINDKIYITLRYSRNAGIKSIASAGALPTAGQQKRKQSYTDPKYTFGRFIVEDMALEAARKSVQAITNLLTSESEGLSSDMSKDLNRQLFGDGTAQLCLLNTAVTAAQTDITVDTPGTKHIYPGALVTLGALSAGEVTAVTTDNLFSLSSAAGATADNAVVRKSTSGNEMMGLKGIVDDGGIVATLQNITRSANAWWKAYTEETSAALTTTYVQTAFTEAEKYEEPTMAITTYTLRDKLAALLQVIRRQVNTIELEGGFTGIEYNGKAVVPDNDCTIGPLSVSTQGYFYWLNMKSLSLEQLTPMSWMERDGQILKYVAGYPQWDAIMRYYANLVTNMVRKNTALSNKTS